MLSFALWLGRLLLACPPCLPVPAGEKRGIQFREESRQSPLDQPLWHSPHHDGNKQGDAKEQTRPSDQEGIGGCHRMGAGFHDRS